MAFQNPRARHLTLIPTAAFVLLDAVAVALAGLVAFVVVTRAGLGGLGSPGQHLLSVAAWKSWLLFESAAVPVALYALGQHRFLGDPTARWSYLRVLLVLVTCFWGMGLLLSLLGQPFGLLPLAVLHFLLALLLLGGWRAALARRLRRDLLSGRLARNSILVGVGSSMVALGAEFAREPMNGRRLVGFVGAPCPQLPDDLRSERMWSPPAASIDEAVTENALRQPRAMWASYSVSDDIERRRILDGLGVEELYVDSGHPRDEVHQWIRLAQERGIDVHLVPSQFSQLGIAAQPWILGRFVLLDIHRRPMSRLGGLAKRGMDIVGGVVGLVLGSPFMLAAAIAIKLESGRLPVFYSGRRIGMKGRAFRMLKFTTMRPDAQSLEFDLQHLNQREGPWFKIAADKDPRLTRSGRWIRKLTINEIPQFWNVLKGDMSLVGPRPPTPEEVATYLQFDVRYFQVLDAKPGMTGLWQVTARHDPSFERRLDLDLRYIREWTVWRDLAILFRTFAVVFDRES